MLLVSKTPTGVPIILATVAYFVVPSLTTGSVKRTADHTIPPRTLVSPRPAFRVSTKLKLGWIHPAFFFDYLSRIIGDGAESRTEDHGDSGISLGVTVRARG